MSKCPECGNETAKILKEWDYFIFRVKCLECIDCKNQFRAYYKQGKFSHTIPKNSLSIAELKIKKYLRTVDVGSEIEISKALNLSLKVVRIALLELEKKGKISLIKENNFIQREESGQIT